MAMERGLFYLTMGDANSRKPVKSKG